MLNTREGFFMFFVFAWHGDCQIGGVNDFVAAFPCKKEALQRAMDILTADGRFCVQVTDSAMIVLFESDSAPMQVISLDAFRIH